MFMIALSIMDPEVDTEMEAQIEQARKQILSVKGATQRMVVAYKIEQAIMGAVSERIYAWADSDKPDVRTIAADLARMRRFRQMLKTLPKPRKAPKRIRKARRAG